MLPFTLETYYNIKILLKATKSSRTNMKENATRMERELRTKCGQLGSRWRVRSDSEIGHGLHRGHGELTEWPQRAPERYRIGYPRNLLEGGVLVN